MPSTATRHGAPHPQPREELPALRVRWCGQQFVDHRFRGRCGFEGCVDDDPVGAVGGGVAVRAAGDRLAGDGPSSAGHDRGDAVVDRVRIGAGEQLGDFLGLGVSSIGSVWEWSNTDRIGNVGTLRVSSSPVSGSVSVTVREL